MEIKKIDKKNWDYILFSVGGKKVLTVMFFDQIDYPRSFLIEDIQFLNIENFSELSEQIRQNYGVYKDFEITPPITKEKA